MPSHVAWIVVGSSLLWTLVVVAMLRIVIRAQFNKLAERFPPAEVADDAVIKKAQSGRFGLVNAGFSLTLAADDAFVHLSPNIFLRWFGARELSIPATMIAEARVMKTFGVARVQLATPAGAIQLPTWIRDHARQRLGFDAINGRAA